MVYRRLYIIPISVFFLVVVTFIITYAIAVALEHVDAGFPYISETGTTPPESCVFAQFVNIAAAVLLVCVYVRYRQVKEISRLAGPRASISPRINKIAGYFGALACLGLDMVANFQESNVIVVHLIGAFICFAGGTVFFCMQTWISRRLRPEFNSNLTFYARAIISALCVVFTFLTIIPAAISTAQFKGKDKMRWQPEDGGWEWHIVSTASEWLLVICFCTFILSFSLEFRGISLEEPVIRIEGMSSKSGESTRDELS
ncbi:DNA damage-regulated autophagy modulator protein 2 [Anabrus simplex]|uniref:DNA damage-regulated autophagy modulator protein 2 n=1 Tax=Anabrus simplex TaxID=316456 RepID=UPI0034DD556C